MSKINFKISKCESILKMFLRNRINHVIYQNNKYCHKKGDMLKELYPRFMISSDRYGMNPILLNIELKNDSYYLEESSQSLLEYLGESICLGNNSKMEIIPYVDSVYEGYQIRDSLK